MLFAGTGESGTCPLLFRGLRFNAERRVFRIDVKEYEGACTDDFRPRTMAIAFHRDLVPSGDIYARFGRGRNFAVHRGSPVPQ